MYPPPGPLYFRLIVSRRTSPGLGTLLSFLLGSLYGFTGLLLRGCLLKRRIPDSFRKIIGQGLFFFFDAEVAQKFASTSHYSVSLYAAPPAVLAPILSFTMGRYISETEAAIISVGHCLTVDSARDPENLYVG